MGNWINVNERLPERGQRVIFLDKDKRMIYVGSYRGKGGGGACHFLANNRLMTANWWMPLPEQPERT